MDYRFGLILIVQFEDEPVVLIRVMLLATCSSRSSSGSLRLPHGEPSKHEEQDSQ